MRKLCLLLLLLFSARFAYSQATACSSTISSFPYIQHFASGPGGWTSGGTNSTWSLGYPYQKLYITYPASDSNSWMTNRMGSYFANESSYVESPCFNFAGMISPVIEMKVWWEIEHNHDGAVMQTSIDGGLTWHNVGNFGDPDNWYNSSSIVTIPGGQGWTGRQGSSPGNGSGGWVTIKHKLNGLSGQNSVRLRIYFASGPSYEDDGFAFDDVKIYDSPAHDAGVTAIVSPVSKCGSTTQENVIIQVKNYGYLPQNTIPVSYQVGNNPPVTETINALIQPEATYTYTFSTKLNLATPGTYQITAQTHLPNDTILQNNAATFTANAIPTISAYPYFQNFENGNGGWLESGQNSSWEFGTPQKFTINSAASGANAWVTSLTGNYNADENSAVTGPCFNMSSLVSPLLTMKVWWNTEEGYDGAVLQSSINGGATWQTVGNFRDPFNWYNHDDIIAEPGGNTPPVAGWSGTNMNLPSSGSNGWVTVKHLLPGLGGQANVRLRIAFASDAGFMNDEGFAFDDVAIYENPAHDVGLTALLSPVSGNCGASSQEYVTVTVHNFGSASQSNIPLTYQINNQSTVNGIFPGPLAPGASATFSFPTPTNLSGGGTFMLTVSTALPADTFFTNNSITDTIEIFTPLSVFPHPEDFENCVTGDPGELPAGWELTRGNAIFYPYSWMVGNGPTPFQGTGPNTDHTLGTTAGLYLYAPVAGRSGMAGDSTELITPCFNISGLSNPGFSFWYHMAGSDVNQLQIQASTNNGATWTTVTTLSGPQQASEADAWLRKMVSLQGYSGNVKLKFKAKMNNGPFGDIAIDDLKFLDLPSTDVEMVAVQLPAPGCGLPAAADICVTLMNSGTATQSMFPVTYQINNGPAVTEIFTGSIPSGGTAQFCFSSKANLSIPGAHHVTVSVNAIGDADSTNNLAQGTTFSQPVISTLPYFENFDNGNSNWVAGGTNNSWALGTPAKPVINSAASGSHAWVTSLNGTHHADERSYVMSPCFDFSALTGDPDLEMNVWWNAQTHYDGAVIETSTDGGLTWQVLGNFGDPYNWYNDSTIMSQPGNQLNMYAKGWSGVVNSNGSNGWVKVRHKLDGMAGQASVKIRVAFAANAWLENDGFAFDDVRIIDNSYNLAVNSFIQLPINCGYGTSEKVEVELENMGSLPITNVSLQYSVNGGTPATATFAGPLAGATKTNFTFPATANLSAAGLQRITIIATAPNDPDQSNDTLVYTLNNAQYSNLPLMLDFESPATGLNGMEIRTKTRAAITDGTGASFGTGSLGLIMDGVADSSWIVPTGILDPWVENPENFGGVYFCVTPTGFLPTDSLYLEFDLKQLYKDAAANTNFRVTVNGNQTGITYRPPFGGGPANWQHIKVPLTGFISQGTMQIGLESNVKEAYDNGNGTANLIDNVRVSGNPTAGYKETAALAGVRVYPNPNAGNFFVELPASAQNYTLEITDLSGKTILKQVAAGTTQLQLKGVAKGLYLLKISSEKGMATQKLNIK